MLKVFRCSTQTCHLPSLTASVRTTSINASWSRKLSSDIVQTTSRTIVKVRRSTLKIPNITFSLTLWTDTSKGMTTSTSTLDISNLTRHCSTLPPKTTPTKKITIHTPAPPRLHQWRHSKYRVNFLVGRPAIRGHHHYEWSTSHQLRTRTRSRRPLHQGTVAR